MSSRFLPTTRPLAASVSRRAASLTHRRTLMTASASSTIRRSTVVAQTARMVTVPVRHLNLHEYQSKNLMAKYGVRVQKVSAH
jgi:hypothetical protein